jgi:hypothetical protein
VFKRLTWMAMGATAGVGASAWVNWRLKRAIRRRLPAGAGDGLDAMRLVAREVAEAVAEGRATMRRREAELREQLGRQQLLWDEAREVAGYRGPRSLGSRKVAGAGGGTSGRGRGGGTYRRYPYGSGRGDREGPGPPLRSLRGGSP